MEKELMVTVTLPLSEWSKMVASMGLAGAIMETDPSDFRKRLAAKLTHAEGLLQKLRTFS